MEMQDRVLVHYYTAYDEMKQIIILKRNETYDTNSINLSRFIQHS